jgi:hypothetical protein
LDWCTHAWTLGCWVLFEVMTSKDDVAPGSRAGTLKELEVAAAMEGSGDRCTAH